MNDFDDAMKPIKMNSLKAARSRRRPLGPLRPGLAPLSPHRLPQDGGIGFPLLVVAAPSRSLRYSSRGSSLVASARSVNVSVITKVIIKVITPRNPLKIKAGAHSLPLFFAIGSAGGSNHARERLAGLSSPRKLSFRHLLFAPISVRERCLE